MKSPPIAMARAGSVAENSAVDSNDKAERGAADVCKRKKGAAAEDVDDGAERQTLWRKLGLDDSSDEESDGELSTADRERTKKVKKHTHDSHGHHEHRSLACKKRAPQRFVASLPKQGLSVVDINAEFSGGGTNGYRSLSAREKRHLSKAVRNNERVGTLPKKSSVPPDTATSKSTEKQVLKPLMFERGDNVYAAWWPDTERNTSPSWHPGSIRDYEEVEINGQLVPTGYYTVTFDDGDELDDLEEVDIMNKEDFLLKMKTEIKPLWENGDEVYAAWWPDDKRTAHLEWYPGKIKSHREVKNYDSDYGPTIFYDVQFDDGDELDSIEDAYIFNKEDYLLTIRNDKDGDKGKWKGVRNVVDEQSSDLWANTVGYYIALIDGEEQPFSFLSDALRAHDAYVMSCSERKPKKYHLNLPEEWDFSNQNASLQGVPRKSQQQKCETRTSPRISAAIQTGSRIYVKWPRDGNLYKATVRNLLPEKEVPMVKIHYDGKKKHSVDDVSPDLIKGFIEGENVSTDQKVDEKTPTSTSSSSISAENASLLFELASQSMSQKGGRQPDTNLESLLIESNNILKAALEMYASSQKEIDVGIPNREPQTELIEEYKAALFSSHDEKKTLVGHQQLSLDRLVSSDVVAGDDGDETIVSTSDLSCDLIAKEVWNEPKEKENDSSLMYEITSTNVEAKECNPTIKVSESNSSSAHIATKSRKEPESNPGVHAEKGQGEIIVRVTVLDTQIGKELTAITSSKSGKAEASNSKGKENAAPKRDRSAAGHKLSAAEQTQRLPSREGRGKISRFSDEGETGHSENRKSSKKRKQENHSSNNNKKPSNTHDDAAAIENQKSFKERKQEDDAAANSIRNYLRKLQSDAGGNIGARGSKQMKVKVMVSGIQIGKEMPAIIPVNNTACAVSVEWQGQKQPVDLVPTNEISKDVTEDMNRRDTENGVAHESMADQPPESDNIVRRNNSSTNVSPKDPSNLFVPKESFEPMVSTTNDRPDKSYEDRVEHNENHQPSLQHQTECMDDLANACAVAAEQFADSMDSAPNVSTDQMTQQLIAGYATPDASTCLPRIRVHPNTFVNNNAMGLVHPSGLNYLDEASNLHLYYQMPQRMYVQPQQQAWPINMTHHAVPGYGQYHTHFNMLQPVQPVPQPPMPQPHVMASPSTVFRQHGMSPNWTCPQFQIQRNMANVG